MHACRTCTFAPKPEMCMCTHTTHEPTAAAVLNWLFVMASCNLTFLSPLLLCFNNSVPWRQQVECAEHCGKMLETSQIWEQAVIEKSTVWAICSGWENPGLGKRNRPSA